MKYENAVSDGEIFRLGRLIGYSIRQFCLIALNCG